MKKQLIKVSSLLLLFVTLNSCSFNKIYKLKKQGEFTKVNFLEEINFRYSNNLILVDIQIEDRFYTCILDTGAGVSIFDSKLFDEISHKEVANSNVSGAAGIRSNFKFLEIPKVNIGSLAFFSLVAISADLSPIARRLKCDETIHGIIGSNMMRKAKWRIDYQQQKVWISDKLSSFDDLENDIIIKLDCGKVGSTYIDTSLDGIQGQYTFDTGKSSGIQSNIKTFNKLLELNKNLEYTQSKGAIGITLNGIQYGTTNYTLINEMNIGGIVLNN
ncbi:MAG: hypothetical protein ACI94Y_003019 [Maribacter sp.]|jgi:hypothetical protein